VQATARAARVIGTHAVFHDGLLRNYTRAIATGVTVAGMRQRAKTLHPMYVAATPSLIRRPVHAHHPYRPRSPDASHGGWELLGTRRVNFTLDMTPSSWAPAKAGHRDQTRGCRRQSRDVQHQGDVRKRDKRFRPIPAFNFIRDPGAARSICRARSDPAARRFLVPQPVRPPGRGHICASFGRK